MNRIFGGQWLVGLVGAGCAVFIGACVGTSSEVGKMDDPDAGMTPDGSGGEGNGAACEPGTSKLADDGCNSCSCTEEGTWACTEIGCECTAGATKMGDDGCSTCVCKAGAWACDDQACPCTPGEISGTGCGACTCIETDQGLEWACPTIECSKCVPGSTKASDDMCSTCTCGMDGTWQCPPLGTGCAEKCEEGAMKPAGDGCNTCQCFHGTWGCTMAFCQQPLMCSAGTGDCNADPADGCETKLETDVMNCGACGNDCALAGGTAICAAGTCKLGSCMAGYADCDGDPANGCEAPVGPAGCSSRCDAADHSLEVTEPTGDCKCPEGTACVRNSAKGKGDLCFPLTEGCNDGLGTCSCLGSCVCDQPEGVSCTDQMAVGGVFILDCAGIQ